MRITGPPAHELFAPMPRAWVIEALSGSISWHRAHRSLEVNSVLNACRAWLYAEEGVLGSKAAGASWAIQRWRDPSTIKSALESRQGQGHAPAEAHIAALLDHVEAAIDRQRPTSTIRRGADRATAGRLPADPGCVDEGADAQEEAAP